MHAYNAKSTSSESHASRTTPQRNFYTIRLWSHIPLANLLARLNNTKSYTFCRRLSIDSTDMDAPPPNASSSVNGTSLAHSAAPTSCTFVNPESGTLCPSLLAPAPAGVPRLYCPLHAVQFDANFKGGAKAMEEKKLKDSGRKTASKRGPTGKRKVRDRSE